MNLVWELDLPNKEQAVMLVMADHANDDGRNAFPSVPLIAWKTCLSGRTVQRVLRRCEAMGILVRESGGNGGRKPGSHKGQSTVYRLMLENGKRKPPFRGQQKGDSVTPLNGAKGARLTPLKDDSVTPLNPQRVTDRVAKGDKTTPKVGVKGDTALSPEPSINHPVEPPSIKNISASAPADAVLITASNRRLTGWRLDGFLRFWDAFGLKRDKAESADAWLDITDLTPTLIDEIVVAAQVERGLRRAEQRREDQTAWAPKWLRRRRFADEIYRPRAAPRTSEAESDQDLQRRCRIIEQWNADMERLGRPDLRQPVPRAESEGGER